MGIFSHLFSTWRGRSNAEDRSRILQHWGLTEQESEENERHASPDQDASHYDRVNWRKKLQRILDELPESQPEWKDFYADAFSLGLGDAWIQETLRDEFTLLIRRAVADHVITDAEHRKLDLAHQLIGLTDAQAEALFQKVVTEAEKFFGTHVEGA